MRLYVGMEACPDEGGGIVELGCTEHDALFGDLEKAAYPLLSTLATWGRNGHFSASKIPELLGEIDIAIAARSSGGTKLELIRGVAREAMTKGRPVSFIGGGGEVSSLNVLQGTPDAT